MHSVAAARLFRVLLVMLGIVVIGSAGYVWLEGWPFSDSYFMTIITLSTVGYGETQELSTAGRWYTCALIFCCIVAMTFWTAALTSFIVESDLAGDLSRRRILRMISRLKDHAIICGAGRMAEAVIERLVAKGRDVVVVDEDKERLEELQRRFRKLLVVEGSATNELNLAKANILNAKHVVAALDAEVDNLLISITCKDMGSEVSVFARSNDVTISNRMRKAGVDEVISPSQICGDRVSSLILA